MKLVLPVAAAVALLSAPAAYAQLANGNFGTNGAARQLTVNTTLGNWTGGGKEGNFGSATTPPVFVFPAAAGQTGVDGDGFNWAGAQQQGYSGPTTEKWQVSFGAATQSTATVSTPRQGFVGWQSASMSFTPTNSSQVLKFKHSAANTLNAA